MILTVNGSKTVDSYPYGRLRTTATFSLEFKPGKGFRSVFQTVNPKTGRINNPKKGTYHDIMFMSDTDGFIKFHAREFYHVEKFNDMTAMLSRHFHLFTPDQVKHLYARSLSFLKTEVHAYAVYCNVMPSQSLPIVKDAMDKAVEGFKNPTTNLFESIKIDHVKLESLKDPNYNPFTVRNH